MKDASFLKMLWLEVRCQNRIRMGNVRQILYLGWGPTTAWFMYSIMAPFGIVPLYLLLKYVSCDLKSLCSLQFDMRSVRYLLYNGMNSYKSGKWRR
jgi:hypothetical protein